MTVAAYRGEQIGMEAATSLLVLGFGWLILRRERTNSSIVRPSTAPTDPETLDDSSSPSCLSALQPSAATVERAGGSVHYTLRRVGLAISLALLLEFVDGSGVFGIWPTSMVFLTSNLAGAFILLVALFSGYFSFETLSKLLNPRALQSSAAKAARVAMVVVTVIELAWATEASFAVAATGSLTPQGIYLLWAFLLALTYTILWIVSLFKLRAYLSTSCARLKPSVRAPIEQRMKRFTRYSGSIIAVAIPALIYLGFLGYAHLGVTFTPSDPDDFSAANNSFGYWGAVVGPDYRAVSNSSASVSAQAEVQAAAAKRAELLAAVAAQRQAEEAADEFGVVSSLPANTNQTQTTTQLSWTQDSAQPQSPSDGFGNGARVSSQLETGAAGVVTQTAPAALWGRPRGATAAGGAAAGRTDEARVFVLQNNSADADVRLSDSSAAASATSRPSDPAAAGARYQIQAVQVQAAGSASVPPPRSVTVIRPAALLSPQQRDEPDERAHSVMLPLAKPQQQQQRAPNTGAVDSLEG